MPKSHFWQSAPHLPHTCGFCGKSEFAAFIKGVPLKYAAKRENRPPKRHRRGAAGFLSKSRKFVSSARNKFRESFHEQLSRKQNRAFAPRTPICAQAPQRVNAARVLKRRAPKSAPQRAEPSPSEDFVLTAQNKISE